MDLRGAGWTLFKRLGLAYSIVYSTDLSLLQRQSSQSAFQEKHGSMGDCTFSSISLLGTLGPGQEALYETCAACALSTFVCLHLKRASDTQTTTYGYLSTKGQETSCVKLVHIVIISIVILH